MISFFVTRLLALTLACGAFLAAFAVAEDKGDKKPEKLAAAKEDAKTIPWLSSLSEGYRRALADRKPLLIRVGANWSAPSRKLASDVQQAAVQAELARWTPVALDLDAQPNDAEELGVVAAPALRIRTPGGQHVAGHDDYLAPDELVEWLKKHYDAATAAADDVLLDSGEPSATAMVRLVKQFRQRNPALREAAIRRLSPYPDIARPAVLKTFRDESLAARLAALELLEQWKAPLAGLDPWRLETYTDDRLARLDKWKDEKVAAEEAAPKQLTEEQLASARRQIERMLKADEAEADAIRHHLARWSTALMPEVYARLKDAATDLDRRRLLTLRYRLAAVDALVLRWPGGLERLADTDPRQRQQAAEELAKLAGKDDQPLLLELFADSDPLVREIGLRGLQHVGGKQANAALVKLLTDPEPNVRAAVLKQLEESPDAAMAPAVVKYLKDEKDPDLIVHGIRFLQAAKGTETIKCLMSLLKHESWQVRAEAAAGIGKLSDRLDSSSSSIREGKVDAATQLQVDAYVALLDLLDDADAFVVAKAVEGLSRADMAVAVEPLVKAADKHPDLAANVLGMLASGKNMRAKALPHLRKFCKHEQSRVRAAAVAALCRAFDDVEAEMLAALDDKESEVRIAAAATLFRLLEDLRGQAADRPGSRAGLAPDPFASTSITENLLAAAARLLGGVTRPAAPAKPKPESKPKQSVEAKGADKKDQPAGAKPEEEKNRWDQWLEECYAGKHRPKWTVKATAPLEKMLEAETPKERVAAALALVPLGKADRALPVLRKALRSNPELLETAQEVLPWLVWQQRLNTFEDFLQLATGEEAYARLIGALSEVPDRRAADPLWTLLADVKVTDGNAQSLAGGLMAAYVGKSYGMSSDVPAAARRELAEAAKPRTTAGGDRQRLAALTLLAAALPDEAAEAAARLADDPKLGAPLRTDAFQVRLLVLSGKEAPPVALAALKGTEAARKKIALKYLVHGPAELASLQSGFRLYLDFDRSFYSSSSRDGTPIIPKPPAGVEAEHVRPLVGDSDAETAACAGYLLALLGEPDGMEPLLKYWRENRKSSSDWGKLVYRAIAVVDDPKYIPVLREIHAKFDRSDKNEFYWTIRIMSGPEILKFRKQVREEIGASSSL